MVSLLSLGRDTNGNKVLRYKPDDGQRGFSIQTLGNLPQAHRMTQADMKLRPVQVSLMRELRIYIRQHGTDRQRAVTGVHHG